MNDIVQGSGSPPGKPYPEGMTPPAETLELAKGLLSARHAELSARRQRQRVEIARIHDRARNLALPQLQADGTELRLIEQERRKLIEQRLKGNGRVRGQQGGAGGALPRSSQAGLIVAGPPYDFDWVSGNDPGFEHADRNSGNYDLNLQSIGGGGQSAGAGVGFWFYSGDGNPNQRFAALIDYTDDWWDSADFYVAHNNAHTRLWVYGASEKGWVVRSDQTPSWSDGVGWQEDHGNDPDGEEGRVSIDTYFNAAPNSWYQCWIWSEADVYADGGFWGISASSMRMNISVRFAVLGRL